MKPIHHGEQSFRVAGTAGGGATTSAQLKRDHGLRSARFARVGAHPVHKPLDSDGTLGKIVMHH